MHSSYYFQTTTTLKNQIDELLALSELYVQAALDETDKKFQAALTLERNTIEFTAGEFTGWINPPEYTKLQPALIGKKAGSLIVGKYLLRITGKAGLAPSNTIEIFTKFFNDDFK